MNDDCGQSLSSLLFVKSMGVLDPPDTPLIFGWAASQIIDSKDKL